MEFVVTVDFYVEGQGYSYSTELDSGETDGIFTAEQWCDDYDFDVKEDEWAKVNVKFYAAADDEPIHTETCTVMHEHK